ncbi:MAG: oligosaccharide flippase family protein [Candidatus Kerfeldbacteria bacterium]
MSVARKIAQNTAIQVGGKLIGTVLSLIAAGFVLRYLGDAGFGKYTTIVAFLQVFGILMDFGLYIIMIKKLAVLDDNSTKTASNIFTLRVISGIGVLALAPLAAWIISFWNGLYTPEIITSIALTTFFFLFVSLNQLLSGIFQKFLRTDWIALAELAGKAVLLFATLNVIWAGLDLIWVMATRVVSSGTNFLVNFLASRKYIKLRFTLDWALTKEIIKEAWPIALSIFFGLMYFKGDTVILTFFESEQVVGWYGAPYKILEVMITFPAMFAGLVLPVITNAWKTADTERFRRMLQKSFDALSFIAIPMIAGTLVLAPDIIQVIAGNEFGNSVPILRILIVAAAAIFVGTLFTYLVVALDKQRTMIFGYAFAAVTSLVGYFIFIPRYSIYGAAWVTVYSEIAILLIALGIVLYTSRVHLSLYRLLKAVLSSAIMFLLLAYLAPVCRDILFSFANPTWAAVYTLAIAVPAGGLVYVLLLFLSRGLSIKDVRSLTSLKKNDA